MTIMTKPIERRGGRRPGAGRKKVPSTIMRDAIDTIDVPSCIKRLEEWAKGKEVICPHCGCDTGARTADTVALQSIIELLNRKLGKPVQKSISLTANIQLSGDDVDELIERYHIATSALLPEGGIIEYEETQESVPRSNSQGKHTEADAPSGGE